MTQYIVTVNGCPSRMEAFSFFLTQIINDYSPLTGDLIASRGFKRSLMCSSEIDDHIRQRLGVLHENSPVEFVWLGPDDISRTKSTYVLYCIL